MALKMSSLLVVIRGRRLTLKLWNVARISALGSMWRGNNLVPACLHHSLCRREESSHSSQAVAGFSSLRTYASGSAEPVTHAETTTENEKGANRKSIASDTAWLWAETDWQVLLQKGLVTAKSAKQFTLLLWRLAKLHNASPNARDFRDRVVEDKDFKKLCRSLEKVASHMRPSELLSVVQTLSKFLPKDQSIIPSLENELLWKMKDMTVAELLAVLEAPQGNFSPGSRIVAVACANLVEQADQIQDHKTWTRLVHCLGQLHGHEDPDPQVWDKVEKRLLELCNADPAVFRPKDLSYVMRIMGLYKRRNIPLLYRMSECITAEPLDCMLSVKQLASLAETCGSLNFFDTKLLQAVGDAVVLKSSLNDEGLQTDVASLLHSFGVMRWRQIEALNKLCDSLLDNLGPSVTGTANLVCMLMTCSNANFVPSVLRDNPVRFSELVTALRPLEAEEPKLWLDVVWSAAVLHLCTAELAASVLREDFVTLLQEKGLMHLPPVQLKLLNVNSIAGIEVEGYSGPYLPMDFVERHSVMVPHRTKRPKLTAVVKAIDNIVPSNKFLKLDVFTPFGYTVDVELLVNSDGILQSLTTYGSMFKEDGGIQGTSALPEDFHRVAVKVLDFAALTQCTVGPTGLHAMAFRYLRSLGYNLVVIPHHRFNANQHVVKQVQYMQKAVNWSIRNGGKLQNMNE